MGTLGRTLVIYAMATWVYSFFLFVGIALLIYAFFFKVLGIFLFAVEIAWFILRPFWREVIEWWKRQAKLRLNVNTLATLSVLFILILLAVTPWRGSVGLPAVLLNLERALIHAPAPARLDAIEVARGRHVTAGDILFRQSSDSLDHQI